MLLMGFNGLFTRLEDEFASLMECMDGLNVQHIWKKVDVVKEAKGLQVSQAYLLWLHWLMIINFLRIYMPTFRLKLYIFVFESGIIK